MSGFEIASVRDSDLFFGGTKMGYRGLTGRLALLFAVVLARPDLACASTFTYSSYSVANPQNITILTPNNVVGAAGQITLVGSGANAGQTLQAWCLDVFTYLAGSQTYQISSLTTAGAGSPNPALTSTQIAQIGALMANGSALINTSTNVSAAIQLAIWQTEYGSSFTFSGLSSAVSNLANTYLANVAAGGIWSNSNYGVTLYTASGDQSLGSPVGTQGNTAVTPLPASWIMMMSGLAGLSYIFRRRKKQNGGLAIA